MPKEKRQTKKANKKNSGNPKPNLMVNSLSLIEFIETQRCNVQLPLIRVTYSNSFQRLEEDLSSYMKDRTRGTANFISSVSSFCVLVEFLRSHFTVMRLRKALICLFLIPCYQQLSYKRLVTSMPLYSTKKRESYITDLLSTRQNQTHKPATYSIQNCLP